MTDSPFPAHTDFLSRHGAALLAQHIVAFWKQRGYVVRTERYPIPNSDAWGVRSNLVNGLPWATSGGTR